MTRKLFGTDGIRGIANVAPMTPEMAIRLGMAVAVKLGGGATHKRIVIGKDTRLSGYMFETALAAGIVAMGGDVWVTGPLPTPGIAFITSSMRAEAGIVISASHNPYHDNGIKLFARDGFKLDDTLELEIEALIDSADLESHRATYENVGYTRRIDDAIGRYVVFCKGTFPQQLTLEGLKIVLDCAHGAAYKVAPAVFSELGAQIIPIHTEPNGRNINDGCGALHPEIMCKRVVEEGANLGLAFDGDADRVILCDENGEVVDGDAVMALCGTRMLERGDLAKQTLVTTVMSNLGLERAMKEAGGSLIRTQVGDRYVVEAMRKGGYNFGGEQSGHLVFLDHMTTGDGIVAGLRILDIMVEEEKPLSELAACMERAPQVLVNRKVAEKRPLQDIVSVVKGIKAIEDELGDEGRVLVRYSGTEAKVRVMIEGPDQLRINQQAEELADLLVRELGAP
jgi:phosphoglucosamine mutase